MARIDNVTLSRSQLLAMNRPERRDQQQALALHEQHKETLAAEERLRAAPLCVNREARVSGKVRAGLHKERLVSHLDRGNVAGSSGCERNFSGTTSRSKGRDKSRFATCSSLDRAEESTLHLGH